MHFRVSPRFCETVMSRTRNYCFTLNYAALPPFTFAPADLGDQVRFLCGQEEVGEAGTHHFQGYLELHNPKTLSSVLKLPLFAHLQDEGYSLHLEPRRGSQAEAIAYCSKSDETSIPCSYIEYGTRAEQGKRTDLSSLQEMVLKKRPREELWDAQFGSMLRYHKSISEYARIKATPRHTKTVVFLFVGPSGRGKSTTAHLLAKYLTLSEGQSSYYIFPEKSTGFWCDDYDNHAVALLDEMDGSRITPTMFNTLCDRFPCVVPAHGGPGHQFIAKYLIVCSNYLPKYWWRKRAPEQVLQTTRRIDVVFPFLDPVLPKSPSPLPYISASSGQLIPVPFYH